jgi:hypothetical protein
LKSSTEEITERHKTKIMGENLGIDTLCKWEEIKRTLKIKYMRLCSGMNWFR